MLKKILSIFLIIPFSNYIAKASTNKTKELEKISHSKVLKDDETTLDLEATFKFNYNKHFNLEKLKNNKNSIFPPEESKYDIDFFNSKFKISFYDDIELYIPFGISYKIGYPNNLNNIKYLTRKTIANLGFLISWKALDYLKLGVSGDLDEDNGYVINFESKLFTILSNIVDTSGEDAFKYGLRIFSQFDFKRSCLEFKPRIRLRFNNEYNKGQSNIIFTPFIGLPLDFKWELIEDLKFMINLSLNSYMSFVSKEYLKEGKYKNSGLKLDSFLKLALEYKLFNVFKLTVPIKISSNIEVLKSREAISSNNIFHCGPKFDFVLDILNNLKLLADVSVDYKFFEIINKSKEKLEFKSYIDPKLRWGIGFKFNSSTY